MAYKVTVQPRAEADIASNFEYLWSVRPKLLSGGIDSCGVKSVL